jgi:hypothetical protein
LNELLRPVYNQDAVDERTLENVNHQSYLATIDSRGDMANSLRASTRATLEGTWLSVLNLKLLYAEITTWIKEREQAFNDWQEYQYPTAAIVRTLNFCGLEQTVGDELRKSKRCIPGVPQNVKLEMW